MANKSVKIYCIDKKETGMKEKEENDLERAKTLLNEMLAPLNKEDKNELLKLLLALTKDL